MLHKIEKIFERALKEFLEELGRNFCRNSDGISGGNSIPGEILDKSLERFQRNSRRSSGAMSGGTPEPFLEGIRKLFWRNFRGVSEELRRNPWKNYEGNWRNSWWIFGATSGKTQELFLEELRRHSWKTSEAFLRVLQRRFWRNSGVIACRNP